MKKPNGWLCICFNPKLPNRAILHLICRSKILEEIQQKVAGTKFFILFDATKDLFHILLNEPAKVITAVLTYIGICVFKMLAMGHSSSTNLFESLLMSLLVGLNGMVKTTDDILTYTQTYLKKWTDMRWVQVTSTHKGTHMKIVKQAIININS